MSYIHGKKHFVLSCARLGPCSSILYKKVGVCEKEDSSSMSF